MSVSIRHAHEGDLSIAYDVQREASAAAGMEIGNVNGPAGGLVPAKFRHELHHGRFLVAEVDGQVVGFGAVFQRQDVSFLATFYVRSEVQLKHMRVGQLLLDELFDGLGPTRSVVSSAVPRALAIYARNGILPRWPLYMLEGPGMNSEKTPDSARFVEPATYDDPELIRFDAQIANRGERTVDHEYWKNEYASAPVWIHRGDVRIGYAWVQRLCESPDAPWNPGAVALGPVGVVSKDEAAFAVEAVVAYARAGAERLLINVPGAHPALRGLLSSGFRIRYQATYCSSVAAEVFDPCRYIPADTITL